MTYQPSHRRPREPRWHDRPRAWLARLFRDRVQEILADDNGEPIDLPPVRYGDPPPGRVVPAVPTSNGDWAGLKGTISRFNPAWAPCWSREDVPRPGAGPGGAGYPPGPGYRQNVPRPGSEDNLAYAQAGPGYLSMFDIRQVRDPWPPRTWPAVISGPRIRPELRTALLAGTA